MRAILSFWRRRWEWLEEVEAFHWLQEQKLAFVVVNININYRRPAVLGDVLTIDSEITQLNGKSGIIAQRVLLAGQETVVADAALTLSVLICGLRRRLRWKGSCASD